MSRRVSCGFDLRVSAEEQGEIPAHWNQSLLGSDNRCPISADTMVWQMPDEVDRLIQDATQEFWNPLGLSNSLDSLLQACRERDISFAELIPVCLTVSMESMNPLIKRCGPGYFENVPDEDGLLLSGWRLLGLDTVQLNGLHSGLKGIGYKEPSWSQYREQFGNHLNDIGLFSDETIASRFAELRGLEIPSHAPFEVVGVLVHDPISNALPSSTQYH